MIGGLILILFPFLFALAKADGDVYVKENKRVSHPANAAQLIIIAATLAGLSKFHVVIYDNWEILEIFLAELFIYWNCFDVLYNKLQFPERPAFELGTTAKLDILQRRFWPLFLIKLALLPASLFVLMQFVIR